MSYILQTHQLTKVIGGKPLVRNVALHVSAGEIYGFLGPNGAGKTTVMKLVTNLWKPTSGSIELFGAPLTPTSYAVLRRMSSILEFPTFYEHMTGAENLQLHCDYMGYHHPGAVEQVLKQLDLADSAGQPVKRYSLGMKQRLGLARAILCRPELLVLDEPTNGLDPAGRRLICQLLKRLSAEYGVTVLISSHILSEIESIADTIGILVRGTLRREVPRRIIEEGRSAYIELSVPDTRRAAYVLSDQLGLRSFRITENDRIRIYDPDASTQDISRVLTLNGVAISAIAPQSETLEDYFLNLTAEEDAPC